MSSERQIGLLNNLNSRMPNKVLDRQLGRNLPLQRTDKTITYPEPQLFDKTQEIDHRQQYPFVHLETQPFDPDFTPPSQHHECYRARIARCFPGINPYYRHYMPNTNKPWMFDTDFQLFHQWVDHHEPHYAIWNEKAGPFPQDTPPPLADPPKRPARKKRREPWSELRNPLTQPYDEITPPSKRWDKYDHKDPRFDQTSLSYSSYDSD
jgi:hypothetical protein